MFVLFIEIVNFGQLKEAIDQPAIKKHSAINALSPTARFVQDQCSKVIELWFITKNQCYKVIYYNQWYEVNYY